MQAPIVDPAANDPLRDWNWLVQDAPVPFFVTALGDVFVRTALGEVWFLDTYRGVYERAAPDEASWSLSIDDPSRMEHYFSPDLLADLRASGLHLAVDECYSPILPVGVGGTMDRGNLECSPWLLHVSLAGQVRRENRKHPDGTPIAEFCDEGDAQPGGSADTTSRRR